MNSRIEWILTQVGLIIALAVGIGVSSLTVGTVRTSINATYINSTHPGTEIALDNYMGVMGTYTEIIGPLLIILMFLWTVSLIWQFRRVR